MNAVTLLIHDHQQVSGMFARFDEADERARTSLAGRICTLLGVHTRIEEELFYPAARQALGRRGADLIDEAAVEHASVKDLMRQIEHASDGDPLLAAKVHVMAEYVAHHLKEEETELFPKLQRTELDLEALGARLEERKRELLAESDVIDAAVDENELEEASIEEVEEDEAAELEQGQDEDEDEDEDDDDDDDDEDEDEDEDEEDFEADDDEDDGDVDEDDDVIDDEDEGEEDDEDEEVDQHRPSRRRYGASAAPIATPAEAAC